MEIGFIQALPMGALGDNRTSMDVTANPCVDPVRLADPDDSVAEEKHVDTAWSRDLDIGEPRHPTHRLDDRARRWRTVRASSPAPEPGGRTRACLHL